MIPLSRLSLLAAVCALALAGILISPAVPSPPTVVGKGIQASVISLTVAAMPPACALAGIVLALLARTLESVTGFGRSVAGPSFLPLRR